MSELHAPDALAPATPPHWSTGIEDPEIRGHLQTKGWDKLEPATAVAQAVKAHREVERMIGVPADKVLRLPADQNDTAGWAALNAKLGVPTDPTAYDLTGIADQALQDTLRGAVATAGLRPDQAAHMASAVSKHLAEAQAATTANTQRENGLALERLRASWGPNFDTNEQIADRAFSALGGPKEALEVLKGAVGADKVMGFLLDLGHKMGEAKFVTGQNPAGGHNLMSVEQVQARKAELMSDTAFTTRWHSGDTSARSELLDLDRRLVAARHAARGA